MQQQFRKAVPLSLSTRHNRFNSQDRHNPNRLDFVRDRLCLHVLYCAETNWRVWGDLGMLKGTPQNRLSIEDLVSNPGDKYRTISPAIHEDPWPSGSISLPVVGRFPDLDRMASDRQDRPAETVNSTDNHGDAATESEGVESRRGRWISPKLSAQVLGGAGLLILLTAILSALLFPSGKSGEPSDVSQAPKAKPSASAPAIAVRPVNIPKSPVPGNLPRMATAPGNSPAVKGEKGDQKLGQTPAQIAGKTITPPQEKEKVKTEKPNSAPIAQIADRRSGVQENASAVKAPSPASPPTPSWAVAPGGVAEGGAGGDFVKWPRPASEGGNGPGNPPTATTPQNNNNPPSGWNAAPTSPQEPRVGLLRNPYI
jgi:hypothetical protein